MKNLAKSLVIVSALAVAGGAQADFDDVCPFIGIDYYQAWMKGKTDWNRVFPKSYPGASVYVGARFCGNWAVEIGYDTSTRKTKNWTVPAGTTLFGNTVVTNGIAGSTKVRRSGGHIDLIAYLPICECLDLTGHIGLGWVQPKITTTVSTIPTTAAAQNLTTALLAASGKSKGEFRLAVGLSYMVTECVGLRAKLGWEGTSSVRINNNAAVVPNLGFNNKAFKSSTTATLGAFVKF